MVQLSIDKKQEPMDRLSHLEAISPRRTDVHLHWHNLWLHPLEPMDRPSRLGAAALRRTDELFAYFVRRPKDIAIP